MGAKSRSKPELLAEKLKIIRLELGYTFEKLIEKLNCPDIPLHRASISQYESGHREPPLKVLLNYAKVANIYVEVLINDELELPKQLPNKGNLDDILKRSNG